MVVVPHQPVLQPLSALANQNTATAQTNAANSANTNATTTSNLSNLNNTIFNGLIKKFQTTNTSAQQANAPVASNVNYLTQQLTNQISQNSATNGNTQTNTNTNLTTNVSINNLNANLAKWENYLGNNDYSFTLQQTSGGQRTGPLNVNVTNGEVSSATYADGTTVSADVLRTIPSIEQMFENIRQATGANERADALYNPNRGFPEFVLLSHNEDSSTDDVTYILNNVSINA